MERSWRQLGCDDSVGDQIRAKVRYRGLTSTEYQVHPVYHLPSWHDLTPGSSFIVGLFDERLRGRITHHLLFGYQGTGSLVQVPSNDGAVSVASQLELAAQADTVRLYGFDLGRAEILSDPDVIETVRTILAESD